MIRNPGQKTRSSAAVQRGGDSVSVPDGVRGATRRGFLVSLLWTLSSALFGARHALAGGAGGAPPTERLLEAAVAELFSDLSCARAVGRRYLSRFPESADRRLLLSESLGESFLQRAAVDVGAVRQAVGHRVQEQFRRGETVTLDGWVLARSEGALCALVALS